MKRVLTFSGVTFLALACGDREPLTAPASQLHRFAELQNAVESRAAAIMVTRVHRGRAPVIDGTMVPGEWAGAATFDFDVNLPEGGTAPARLLLKHDGTNLYLAVRYERSTPDAGSLGFEFDNDDNGVRENGDDALVYNPNSTTLFFDDVRTNQSPPCPPGSPPASCGPQDVDVGGTTDGTGAFGISDGFSVYELVHPLNSGDTGHDFALTQGSQVGLSVELVVGHGSLASTSFPAGGVLHLRICCGVH